MRRDACRTPCSVACASQVFVGGTRDVGALVYIVHSLYPEFVRPVAEGTGVAPARWGYPTRDRPGTKQESSDGRTRGLFDRQRRKRARVQRNLPRSTSCTGTSSRT